MPSWEGIEDAATMLPRIWLTRAKDGDVWKPLRKIDCKALNESRGALHFIEANSFPLFWSVFSSALDYIFVVFWKAEKSSSREVELRPIPSVAPFDLTLSIVPKLN